MATLWRSAPRGRLGLAAMVVGALLMADFRESVATAGFLRNGLRPGAHDGGTVRFLRPPPRGARVRIRPPGEPAVSAPALPRQAGRQAWFWAAYSPAADAAAAGRWEKALATVLDRRARGRGMIGVDALRAIRAAWGAQVETAAVAHNVSDALLLAMIAVESRGRPGAVSPKGAEGLMQLIPATARRFGVANALEPAANIDGGAAYLDWLLDEFGGDVLLALAGYNAGEGAVHENGGVPPYPETRDYVVLVLDAVAAAGELCVAPPEGPRQSCRWKPEA